MSGPTYRTLHHAAIATAICLAGTAAADPSRAPEPRPDVAAEIETVARGEPDDAIAALPAPEPASAATPEPATTRGSETNLPLPRYVSLKAAEGNVRRGPSLMHRIDWVYRRRDLPLRVVDEYGHWRRVQDIDGQGGWIHYSLITGTRTALVTADRVALLVRPQSAAPETAVLQSGVVGRLDECREDWCHMRVGRLRGWVEKDALWGVEPGEHF